MLCATLSFFLTLSSIASTNGDLLGFIFLTLLPIRNPQNKHKTKTEKLLLCRNHIFITMAIPFCYHWHHKEITHIENHNTQVTHPSTQNHYLCHLRQRNPDKVNAYPQSSQATPRSIVQPPRSRRKPFLPAVPLKKKIPRREWVRLWRCCREKGEAKYRRLQEIGQLEVAFLNH